MAIDNFKVYFAESYQEIFQKVSMAMKIANTRFKADLTWGATVERAAVNIDNVVVRDVVIGSDMTIDTITDSTETLLVNNHKDVAFALNEKEKIQAGPLNPGAFVGAEVAKKLRLHVDADVLYETVNALYDFDNGDLTTLSSTGTPITLSSTTVPQMVSRMSAKLSRANNQDITSNMCMVIDSYALSDMYQYLLGKNAEFVDRLFQGGYSGLTTASGAEIYISENLTGEALFSMATQPTDGDTVTIGGVVFTFKTALTPTAGQVLIGGSADAARANLTAAINATGTPGTDYVELTAANRLIITNQLRLTATNDNTANTMTIVGKGSGRIIVSETLTNGTDTWTYSFIHCYFGKKGAIDVVVQKDVDIDIRQEPKQKAENYLSTVLYGIKTFADGAKKFLDVKVAV